MKTITFVPCNNGLGHIRRLAFLANRNLKSKIYFCIDKNKKNKFKLNKRIKKLIVKNSNDYNKELIRKKKIYNSDIIFSDNLINQNLIKKNTIIFANFFWEEILNKNIKNLNIVKKIKPKVFSNYLFQNIKLDIHTKKVGFFGYFKPNKKPNAILIATGTAKSRLLKLFKKKLHDELIKNKFKNKKIYLDPKIYNSKFAKYSVKKANFSEKMYSEIILALIKPGLGTIEECLQRGIPIMPIMKNENSEFEHNSKILIKNKLGYDFENFDNLINFVNKIFTDKNFFKQFNLKCKKLKWHGEKKILKYIAKLEKV